MATESHALDSLKYAELMEIAREAKAAGRIPFPKPWVTARKGPSCRPVRRTIRSGSWCGSSGATGDPSGTFRPSARRGRVEPPAGKASPGRGDRVNGPPGGGVLS
jgi:hypothetical protein